ncbi:MAG: hypothetical protein IPK18_06765 [Sphingobacteriales bacterium]|jgi:hypothetical protein|nr:MAG: hypothetical protein IPK18_06765 [Sphingobacteriales bacterium]
MKLTLVFSTILIFILQACSNQSKDEYNSKHRINYSIYFFTDIRLDTTKFEVITDSIHNTEGAFDVDYSWFVKLKFDSIYFENLKNEIRASNNFNTNKSEFDDNWKLIDSNILGIWLIDTTNIRFVQKPVKYNPESKWLSIDTVTKVLELELIHL